jgi:hypothetical protein
MACEKFSGKANDRGQRGVISGLPYQLCERVRLPWDKTSSRSGIWNLHYEEGWQNLRRVYIGAVLH